MDAIALHWLDSRPAAPTGITWGVSLPRGRCPRDAAWHLINAGGHPLPTQCWPLAQWPDGSLKWLGCAAVLGPEHDGLRLRPGQGPVLDKPATVQRPGIEIIELVDTGRLRAEVGDRGRYLLQELRLAGRPVAAGVQLVAWNERRSQERNCERRERRRQVGIIEDLTVEQRGPIRVVLAARGRYRDELDGRLWLPFTARLILYAGCDTVELVHSFVFDGDPERDFIAGLGVEAHVLTERAVHDRHLRVVGEKTVWTEPVRLLPYRGHHPSPDHLRQMAGEAVEPGGKTAQLPAWADLQLFQDSAEHAVLRKRQAPDRCWIDADHCRRAPGIMSLSDPDGGLALILRDFWQAHPSMLEITDAAGTEARLRGWWWSPEAAAMDLRHYGDRDYRDVYEARNPDPAVYSSAVGIARTSMATLLALGPNSRPEDLGLRRAALVTPPLLAADPAHYHTCGVFGCWSPVDRSTPARARMEDELAALAAFHREQVDTWSWYGFWHYGDVMHTYDPQRHVWHYDQGGRAWDNTELGFDVWPWYHYLRSGEAVQFRFAEALTRHVSEVDVFHCGPWAGQGTRHNVVHWGCPCKEPRVSQAGAKRFYHFLTADERCRELLDEVAEQAHRGKATNVPTGARVMARTGPTWVAWMANWLCAWERSGDAHWHDLIRTGLSGILTSQHQLLTAEPYDFDPGRGTMTASDDYPFSNRLAATMGGAEVWMEYAGLVDDPAFAAALADYGAAHAVPPARWASDLPEYVRKRLSLRWGHARLMAWAGRHHGDPALADRAWTAVLHLEEEPGEPDAHVYPWPRRAVVSGLRATTRPEWIASTNHVAMHGLNTIAALALVPEGLERLWPKERQA